MTRLEAVILAAVALGLLTAAAVSLFGAYGMAGAGLVLLVAALLAPTKGGTP